MLNGTTSILQLRAGRNEAAADGVAREQPVSGKVCELERGAQAAPRRDIVEIEDISICAGG
jgi:hypothetical protein